jgi:membrane-bound lytic murein transglycosylase B
MVVLFAAAAALALEPAYVAEVAKTAQMSVAEVGVLLAPLTRDETVLTRMAAPFEKKPWHVYAAAFLTEERIAKGRVFREAHAATLARAEAQYGVPASVVLAILGVETLYGEKMGADSIATSLFTLGFHGSRRGSFFRAELGHFLRLATDQGWDVYERRGSYAGAMGMGQFMPSSYRQWAVDYDEDGAIDLFGDPVDAIGSVAHYLSVHGWESGSPILLEAVPTRGAQGLVGSGLELTQTLAGLQLAGVVLAGAEDLGPSTPARLLSFEGALEAEYRVGLQNFWVITRYNRSPLYARAVVELAGKL